VNLHFGYRDWPDTATGVANPMSGYNAFDPTVAPNGAWPRTQDWGCELQTSDTLGWGGMPSLDIMHNGRVVMAAMSHLGNGFLGDGSAFVDNMMFYQVGEFNCTYGPGFNTTFIDSTVYRQHFMDNSDGNYSRAPQVVTQWDGVNTIVHVLLNETVGTQVNGSNDYVNGLDTYTCTYYRKAGETADAGSWSAGTIIDSLWFPWPSMTAAPYPAQGVAVSYTNPSYYGALLNNADDLDVWYRESLDRGQTWQPPVDVTNYMNGIPGDYQHFTAWIETQALYTDDGGLHVVWTARPTSADPYFDGFNWWDFDADVYHWARSSDDIVKVANGSYPHLDDLCGDITGLHCGFGGSNAGYIANINIAQCNDKLYCIWNQIHERANYNDWRCYQPQPMPGVLDDCSYTGNRLAMANWDIFMSVSLLATSSLWDMPRNISNTYTPNCGLVGDPEAEGPCGSEYKPMVEKRALDESGLELYWPAETIVDLSLEQNYTGGWYLNMQYIDDQFPGPAFWGATNPPGTLNSIKWVRLACVEPVVAPMIAVNPFSFEWPEWVELGQADNLTVTVRNEGNVMLNVTEIDLVESTSSGWLSVSENPTPGAPFQVTSGVVNTATFDIIVDASGLSTTTWLDGEVWLKSDAANEDSTTISLHLLAAAEVEPVVYDTVMSHKHMFDHYFFPEGECVALAVSNHGEIGWGAGTSGSVNLDYTESETECGDREADAIYLQSGSAFVITHNSGQYDSVYTGVFVNRDTSIAMERIFYAPRSEDPANETINFVICYSRFYSVDGAGHNHVTIGNVCDWNVPSEAVNVNTSGLSYSSYPQLVYVQGTDTTGTLSCQSNTDRYATEAFGGGYTSAEWQADNCVNGNDFYSMNALPQSLLLDTTHYRDGTPLVPPQPNPEAWWDGIDMPGLNADATLMDQAVWLTYVHDYSLGATDTLHFWTVLTTVREGELAVLEAQVSCAKNWYWETIVGCSGGGCCIGRVGDANGQGGDEPTIGDVSVMIDAKFITGTCNGVIMCLSEADINQSGGCDPTCDDITIGDISSLICPLFILPWPWCIPPPCLPCNTAAAPEDKAAAPLSMPCK